MNYREINKDNPEYLHLVCSGTWEVESSKLCWQDIAERLKQADYSKVLLDEREVELQTSVNVDFSHAGYVADLMRGICSKVAIIDGAENSETNAFYETVCVNRSLNLRFFLNEAEAIDWLTD
jgi:hypothetical protein